MKMTINLWNSKKFKIVRYGIFYNIKRRIYKRKHAKIVNNDQ